MLVSAGATSDAMVTEMLLNSQRRNIRMDVVVVKGDELRGDDQPTTRHALTLLKEDLGFDVISKVAAAASQHGFNIQQVDRLSPLSSQDIDSGPSLTAVELILEETETSSIQDFKGLLAEIQGELQCDRALQREGSLRRNKRLVVMDMDSTLIINEVRSHPTPPCAKQPCKLALPRIICSRVPDGVGQVIDEIARIHGVYDEVSEVTHRAMNGELDFNESLVERVKCLAGAPESVFDDVYEVISLTPGAPEFIWALKTMGYKVAVVSGGFNQVTNRVAADMGIDFAFANTLEVVGGKLTGRTIGPIVNRERKRDLLESLAQTMSIELEQVIAIGDGQPQRLAAIL